MRTRIAITQLWLVAGSLAFAQDPATHQLGGFETQGSASVGYRFDSIGGRQEKFQELFNLRGGPRLFDFDLGGRSESSKYVDRFQLTSSGLGGDPFPSAQFTASKAKAYDLRVNYRQTYFYWDRNDNAVLPSNLHGLTSNQNWATVRRFGSANLLVHASNRLKFRFEYGRNSRDGMNGTTQTLDYFGSSSAWGTFLRDNPYYVEAPLTEAANRYAVGVDYSLDRWAFHYTVGYQRFNQALSWNVNTPERSINVDSVANTKEFLNTGKWNESRRLSTPSSEFSYNGNATSRLTLRGSFLFFRYSGPANLDASFAGTVRANTAGTLVNPYSISMTSRGEVREPNYLIDQGFTYKVSDWWSVHSDYRYNRFTEHNTAIVQSRDLTTSFDGTNDQVWRQGLHQADVNLEFTPMAGLIIRPGVRFIKRDTVTLEDGVTDQGRTQRNRTVWPIASVAYLPSRKFSVRADVQTITNGRSYTRITPHTDTSTRWVVRYQPTTKLSIEENFVIRNRKLVGADFFSRTRSNGATISWAWNDRLSTFAGFSYDSFLASASVAFLRGTAPLNTSWRDQTINRVWQAGIAARPLPRLGFNFSGNFVRSTGVGQITGEAPTFGPLTFPMVIATGYYDVPRLGRLSLDLQRTYYFEEIVRANDFGANLVTIRWTRGF